MPDRTFRLKNEKCSGGKLSKERITLLVAANMTGTEKRRMLVIGKSKNPRCFKNVKRLPVSYDNNKTAWMTSFIFSKVLKECDTELERRSRKILLLVDNSPSHCSVTLRNIRLEYLPPNTTSVLQPMDQGVIRCLKCYSRTALVMKIIENIERKVETKISLLDAIIMLKKSWDKVSKETIANCFIHSGLSERRPEIQESEEDKLESLLSMIAPEVSSDDFVHIDDEITTAEVLTDEDIAALVQDEKSDDVDDDDENDENTPSTSCPTIFEARAALTILQTFCLTHDDDVGIASLKGLENEIEKIFCKDILMKARQTTLPKMWNASTAPTTNV